MKWGEEGNLREVGNGICFGERAKSSLWFKWCLTRHDKILVWKKREIMRGGKGEGRGLGKETFRIRLSFFEFSQDAFSGGGKKE